MYPQAPQTVAPYQESLAQPITLIALSAVGMAVVLVVTAVLLMRRRHLGVSLTAAVVLLVLGAIGVGSGESWFERTENSNRNFSAELVGGLPGH